MLQQTLHTLHLETFTDQTHKSTHPRVSAINRSANSSNILVTSVTDKGQGPCFPAEVTVVYFCLVLSQLWHKTHLSTRSAAGENLFLQC